MPLPPLVYAGPSIGRELIEAELPGAQLMPPVQRLDLYRDRMLGFSLFLVLDGVFFQRQAVSPREVLDVVADGAVVLGATSMGALRAAECWPGGMQGIGSIYRLFRRGALRSDDEVAVASGPEGEHRITSVALVNVRYAARRAVRDGLLEPDAAQRLVEAAQELYYAHRSWPAILEHAGLGGRSAELADRLAGWDLKRLDALRALRRCRAMIERDPGLLRRPRRSDAALAPNEMSRERPADPFEGGERSFSWPAFWRWFTGSGRAVRLSHVAGAIGAGALADDPPASLRDELDAAGELEAIVYRYTALSRAAAESGRRGLEPSRALRHAVETEIALAHGYPDWARLRAARERLSAPWEWVEGARDLTARARSLRESLFASAQRVNDIGAPSSHTRRGNQRGEH